MELVTFQLHASDGAPPVAVIQMDDGKANALGPALLEALEAALERAARSEAGALVLCGRSGFFSGGLDLKRLPGLPTAEKERVFAQLGRILLRLFTLDMPTVAALTGHAIAGGALLALAADLRIGADLPARFGVTEVAIGLPVPSFGLLLARAALAPPTLLEVTVHARTFTLAEALGRGVVGELHAAERMLPAAIERASGLARLDRAAYGATKRALWAGEIQRVEAGFAEEVSSFVALFEARFGAPAVTNA